MSVLRAELVGQGGRGPPARSTSSSASGSQPEDEVADVADRAVDGLDGALDALRRRRRVGRHQLVDVLERQADGVEPLDEAVVEVLADALALLEHGQLAQLLVHAGVVDGQAGVPREGLHEPLVVLAEGLAALLVGEVQVADDAALDAHRHAQEAVHRRMVGREADRSAGRLDVGDADGAVLADDAGRAVRGHGRMPDGCDAARRRCRS